MTSTPVQIAGSRIPADPALLAQGWERRHLAGAARADEAVELYTSLGFEVRAEPMTPTNLGDGCAHCASAICGSYVLIYVRKPGDESDS